MTTQLGLFDPRPETLPPRFAAFVQYHRDNPVIYQRFVQYAMEAHRAGRRGFGARMVGERIRWYLNVETRSVDGFKINDHHWPYYARLAMLEHTELDGLFETRLARTDATDEMILRHCGAPR